MTPRLRRSWALLSLLVPALLSACGKGDGKSSALASASSKPVVPVASSVVPPESATPPPAPVPICRAIRVSGEATVGAVPLATGGVIDGSDWIKLATGASVSLKHSTSARELNIVGPALFRACRRGREQVLLAKGTVKVGAGMGSRPGAEVLIATPVAGIRYGDADLVLSLDDKNLSLQVRAGQVEVDATGGKPVKSPLSAGDKLTLKVGKPDPVALMAQCQSAAEAAEASARHVGDRTATESLGERAQAHVKARKAARAACTVAAAATGLVADPSTSAGLWAEAVRWEGLWETIPRRSRTQAPEK